MSTEQTTNITIASAAYAALRYGGAPPAHARAQLALGHRVGFELERCFLARKGGAARHERHVRDVLRAGGFPVCREAAR